LDVLGKIPLGTDLSAWYTPSALLAVVLLMGLLTFGVWAAVSRTIEGYKEGKGRFIPRRAA
jgi:hypothetical protein